jgi:hypothetical protein
MSTVEKHTGAQLSTTFSIGYHTLHPDVSVNFQLNRFWNWVGEAQILEELRDAGQWISSYDALTRELLALGEQALAEERPLPAAPTSSRTRSSTPSSVPLAGPTS